MARNCIGLDIGSTSIKAVEVRVTKRGTELVNFGVEPIPQQTIVDGSVMNASAISDALTTLVGKWRSRKRGVALAISGHSLIIKKIAVPQMTREELDEQIEWEAEHHIPFGRDEVHLDYEILDSNPAQNQMEVLLVAAKKETVSDYVDAVRDARLNPVVVDVAAFCLQNCFEMNYGALGETVALLNIGGAISTVNIIQSGQSAFTRDITVGGDGFTDEIQKQLGISYDEAEAYKCGGQGEGEVVPQEVDQVLQQQSDMVAAEFQRSFDFYLATTAEGQIDRICLAGGSALLPALREAVGRRAGVPVEILDPFKGLLVDESAFELTYLRSVAPVAAIAVGLALRSEGDNL